MRLSLMEKILIDAANNLSGGPTNSLAAFRTHTPHASVYRAFNTYGWENFADPLFDGVQADLFYSGPDDTSRVVEQLISEIGLQPVRVGDADQADVIDGLLRFLVHPLATPGKSSSGSQAVEELNLRSLSSLNGNSPGAPGLFHSLYWD